MKRIITLSTLLLLFAIGFSACEKYADDMPQAIKKLIREKNKRDIGCQVIEYEYNNERIYCWQKLGNCADCISSFYDKKANLLWLDGGHDGGNCPEDFYDKAIHKRIIWTSKKAIKH